MIWRISVVDSNQTALINDMSMQQILGWSCIAYHKMIWRISVVDSNQTALINDMSMQQILGTHPMSAAKRGALSGLDQEVGFGDIYIYIC